MRILANPPNPPWQTSNDNDASPIAASRTDTIWTTKSPSNQDLLSALQDLERQTQNIAQNQQRLNLLWVHTQLREEVPLYDDYNNNRKGNNDINDIDSYNNGLIYPEPVQATPFNFQRFAFAAEVLSQSSSACAASTTGEDHSASPSSPWIPHTLRSVHTPSAAPDHSPPQPESPLQSDNVYPSRPSPAPDPASVHDLNTLTHLHSLRPKTRPPPAPDPNPAFLCPAPDLPGGTTSATLASNLLRIPLAPDPPPNPVNLAAPYPPKDPPTPRCLATLRSSIAPNPHHSIYALEGVFAQLSSTVSTLQRRPPPAPDPTLSINNPVLPPLTSLDLSIRSFQNPAIRLTVMFLMLNVPFLSSFVRNARSYLPMSSSYFSRIW